MSHHVNRLLTPRLLAAKAQKVRDERDERLRKQREEAKAILVRKAEELELVLIREMEENCQARADMGEFATQRVFEGEVAIEAAPAVRDYFARFGFETDLEWFSAVRDMSAYYLLTVRWGRDRNDRGEGPGNLP